MRDYVNQYKVKKFQAGGMPMEGAPVEQAPQGGGDPMMELMQAGMQALETQDCEMMGQVLAAFLDVVGGAMQEGAPAMEMGGPIMYKKGGKFMSDASQIGDTNEETMKAPKYKKGSRMKKAGYGATIKKKKKVVRKVK